MMDPIGLNISQTNVKFLKSPVANVKMGVAFRQQSRYQL